MTRISVCIATYNGAKYIEEQIDSILPQLGAEDEIIISDDGSTDGTIKRIETKKDSRIKIYQHKSTGFYTSNFENALALANGQYIFLSDQDDVWFPEKVKVSLEYLQNYDFTMSNAYIVDANENIIEKSRNEFYGVRSGFLHNWVKSRYLGCCFAFRRNVLNKALPFPANPDLCHHDTWVSLIAEKYYRTAIIDQPLVMYRRHGNNTSTGGATRSSVVKIIKIRIYVLYHILRRRHYRRG